MVSHDELTPPRERKGEFPRQEGAEQVMFPGHQDDVEHLPLHQLNSPEHCRDDPSTFTGKPIDRGARETEIPLRRRTGPAEEMRFMAQQDELGRQGLHLLLTAPPSFIVVDEQYFHQCITSADIALPGQPSLRMPLTHCDCFRAILFPRIFILCACFSLP